MKIPLVVIVGPTAVGKSDFAIDYALKHNGEIISADSRQVYKGLNIGTGKITQEEMRGVPHYLLDVASPKTKFNVEKYKKLTQRAIGDIYKKGKLPIICGGTGFYIDAVVKNISYPDVKKDFRHREKLKNKNADELFSMLKKYDSNFALSLNESEANNHVRLLRYIEIAKSIGKIPKAKIGEQLYDVTWIKLDMPIEDLEKRINSRLYKRIRQGMIEEVRDLHQNGLSWKRMEELGLEYRYISRYLRGILTKEEMVKSLQIEIRKYAKRQQLWFRKIK